MGRRPCCAKDAGLNRGAWTAHEDKLLADYIQVHGDGKWRDLPQKAGLKRCGKSCRLRWLNYLRPDIKRGNISPDEEDLIVRLHRLLGNRWSLIAGRLPGRTDNEIKNYWNTKLGKKILKNYNKASAHDKVVDSEIQSANRASPSSSPKMASHVFRPKAFNCSKDFVRQDSQHHGTESDNDNNVKTRPPASSVMVGETHVHHQPFMEVPSLASRENNDDPKNLLMNFEMGDGDHQLFMLEPADAHAFANFEFSYDLNYGNKNNNGDDFSPSSPMLFSEEMLQDLTTTTDYVQPQGFSCLSPFTSFLDSGRVWLGD
ncbi:hypothetical protein P3X46_019604 [Hevea brasiliensis]|uniref:Uncharacterized protein n=1 Tax=Hevea brasiliensis TaxID=3981 RepID=A0ABQ9LJ77_HEVBR|nr:transcription factor MYB1-like [Hevea brasiliensis]KAJ9168026.1 hypothetical protein P3X46_019604 [Hevea brasiliensis]